VATELLSIVQTIGSLASLILIPVWNELKSLRKDIADTQVSIARDYPTKEDCQRRHADINADIKRVHDRIDENKWSK
jgi:hypothetical protein